MWFSKFFKKKKQKDTESIELEENEESKFLNLDSISNNVKFKFDLGEFLEIQQALAQHQLTENQVNILEYVRRKQYQAMANNQLFYRPLAEKGVKQIENFLTKKGEEWFKKHSKN